MKDTVTIVQVWVECGIALLLFALGVRVWLFFFELLQPWLVLPMPIFWALAITTLFNLLHFLFGLFHENETISDLPSGATTFSLKNADLMLLGVRIISIILIGASVHLQKALELTKVEEEGDR